MKEIIYRKKDYGILSGHPKNYDTVIPKELFLNNLPFPKEPDYMTEEEFKKFIRRNNNKQDVRNEKRRF